MELPALLAGSGMKRASSDEVGPGNRPDFCCAETAIGGQALCLPSPKGRNPDCSFKIKPSLFKLLELAPSCAKIAEKNILQKIEE